jgi:hypothetical protein
MPDEGGNAWLGSPRFLPWPAGRPVLFPLRRSGRPDDTGLQAIGSLVGTLGGSFCGCPVGNPEGLFLLPSGPTAYSNFSAAASLAPSSPFGTSQQNTSPSYPPCKISDLDQFADVDAELICNKEQGGMKNRMISKTNQRTCA